MEQADALRIALKKLSDIYQSAYGYEIGAYDELYIDASSISYFLQTNGVDVRALEADADSDLEDDDEDIQANWVAGVDYDLG